MYTKEADKCLAFFVPNMKDVDRVCVLLFITTIVEPTCIAAHVTDTLGTGPGVPCMEVVL